MSIASAVVIAERPRAAAREPLRRRHRAVLLVAPAVALTARLLTGAHPIDDAFITFRYARNLAEGAGLVYNPGEWVLGTTAPLWAVVLGAGYRLGLTDLPLLATIVSAACDAGSSLLLACLAIRIGWPAAAALLVGIAWALNPMSIAFAAGGMETSVFVLIMLVVLALATRRDRAPLAAAIAGAATLLRPEAALLAATVVVWSWITNRRGIGRVALAAAAPMLIAAALLWMRYGNPVPHSVAAKQVAYAPVAPLENLSALLLQAGLPGSSPFLISTLPPAVVVVVASIGLGAVIPLARTAIPYLNQRGTPWKPFALFAAMFLAFYVLIGLRGMRLFSWYLVPIIPLYLVAAAAGMRALSQRHVRPLPLLPLLLVAWQLPAVDWHRPMLPAGEDLEREQLFYAVGDQLRGSLPATATLAAPEIGALGYASNLRILDTVGLVSPAALQFYPLPAEQLITDNAIPAALIAAAKPDAIVALDAYVERTLLTDPTFAHEYQLTQRQAARVWQSRELLIFRRVASDDRDT